jgi:subtilisin family serine protease
MRRALRLVASAGALALAAGLVLGAGAAGPALASGAARGGGQGAEQVGGLPRPRVAQWWFTSWQVQSKVWPFSTGTGVTVAVLDGGVQASVPNLRGSVVPGGDMTGSGTNGTIDDDHTDDGHGTAMSALIVGNGRGAGIAGIAPGAKILPVRIGGSNHVGSLQIPQTAAAGIRFAVGHHAQVINLSVGVPAPTTHGCAPQLQRAVAYALQHNVVVVASAGDAGHTGNFPDEPASCAGVLAVGAVDSHLGVWAGSERQPYVDVAAPGVGIGWSGRDGKYFPIASGTSQAAAFVSGEVALIRARYPGMPWQQVVQRVVDTSLRRGSPQPNDKFGYGVVRIDRAVNASRYPVSPGAPNPVLAAYRAWLKSPAHNFGVAPRRPTVTFSRQSGLSQSALDGLIVVIVVGVVLIAAVVTVVILVSRRRARRRAAPPVGQS